MASEADALTQLRSSLLGNWLGQDSKEVYAGYDGGCYPTIRKFTFTVTFQEDSTFVGCLAQEHCDCFGDTESSQQNFSGTWAASAQPLGVRCAVKEQTYRDDDREPLVLRPVVELRFRLAGSAVERVIIDDSNSASNHEAHCDDLHVIECTKLTADSVETRTESVSAEVTTAVPCSVADLVHT